MGGDTHGRDLEAKPKLKDAGRLTEVALLAKYPHLQEGSLRWNGIHGKQQGTISCVDCGEDRDVFTSDLFQIERCSDCTKIARKDRMKAKKAVAKAAKAAAQPASAVPAVEIPATV